MGLFQSKQKETPEEILERGRARYRKGKLKEAHQLFEKAMDLGLAAGYNAVALDYYYGEGVETDYQKALENFTKAYEMGCEKSAITLAEMYYRAEELEIEKDSAKMMKYLKAAVKLGDAFSMALLSDCYYFGGQAEENRTLAVYYAQKAVEGGEPIGYRALALSFMDGKYLAKCPAYARYCCEAYATLGEGTLEEVLSEPEFEESREEILAAEPAKLPKIVMDDTEPGFFEEDALRLYREALTLLLGENLDGEPIPVNAQKAEKLLNAAARRGHCESLTSAATRYFNIGQGKSVVYDENGQVEAFGANTEKALHYLTLAAEQGDQFAIEGLILLYEEGDIEIEKDPEKVRTYKALLKQLHPEAVQKEAPQERKEPEMKPTGQPTGQANEFYYESYQWWNQ